MIGFMGDGDYNVINNSQETIKDTNPEAWQFETERELTLMKQ